MAARAASRRSPRQAPRRSARGAPRWPPAGLIAAALLFAGACAVAAIAGLFRIARAPDPAPFRFPTPALNAPHAGDRAR
jgi:hypothetical protein